MATATERTDEVRDAILSEWHGVPLSNERGVLRLELSEIPEVIVNRGGVLGGFSASVKLFNGAREVPIDPTRRFWNPPTVPRSGVIRIPNPVDPGKTIKILTPDPLAAFWDAIWQSVTRAPNPTRWRTRGTVTTIYGDTADGYVESVSANYNTARSTGGALGAQSSSSEIFIGQYVATNYFISEGFIGFDTSSLPDTDVVTVVSLSLDGLDNGSDTDFTVNARLRDWGATLTTADWVNGDSLSGLTLLATWATSAYVADANLFTSQAAFISNINLTGFTRLILSSSRQEGANTPTGNEYVYFEDADSAGTSLDPSLTITHGPAGHPAVKRMGGVQHAYGGYQHGSGMRSW